jgi:hypothetical protein
MTPEPELDREWIDRHFAGRIGRFLELGAFDGRTHSKTLGLIEAGWSGVLVEGNARVFLRLLEEHGHNQRLQLLHAVVTPTGGVVPWWDNTLGGGGELSTVSADHVRYWEARGAGFTRYFTATLALARLLEFTGLDFDFLLVDLEGITPDVLAALPLDRMTRTEVLCAEKQGEPDTVMNHIGRWYEQMLVTHDNVVALRR